MADGLSGPHAAGGMSGEEGRALQIELLQQLKEQRESLVGVEAALADDPGSIELAQLRTELTEATTELEAMLMEIKRAGILAQLESSSYTVHASTTAVTAVTPPQQCSAARASGSGSAQSDSGGRCDNDLGSSGDAEGDEGSGEDQGSEGEDEQEGFARLGLGTLDHARRAVEAGIQTDTVHFASWEGHSRGIASKLLAGMGYTQGSGLGRHGKGMVAPVEVQLLPSRQGLGSARPQEDDSREGKPKTSKRSRGGERARRRKHAEAARAARSAALDEQQRAEEAAGAPGLFAFINHSLGARSEAAAKLRTAGLSEAAAAAGASGGLQAHAGSGRYFTDGANAADIGTRAAAAAQPSPAGGTRGGSPAAAGSSRPQHNRQGLLKHQDAVAAVQVKVQRLQEMLQRNSANQPLAVQIRAKLAATQSELQTARDAQARMTKELSQRDAHRKWTKF